MEVETITITQRIQTVAPEVIGLRELAIWLWKNLNPRELCVVYSMERFFKVAIFLMNMNLE